MKNSYLEKLGGKHIKINVIFPEFTCLKGSWKSENKLKRPQSGQYKDIHSNKFMQFVKKKIPQSPCVLILDTFTMPMTILLCKPKQTRTSNLKRWN